LGRVPVARQVRRTAFRGGRAGGRSPTAWAGGTLADATVADATKQVVTSFVPVAGLSHETIVRIVGDWQMSGAGLAGPVALGGVIATDIAFAAGAASIPGPITDIEDDIWMFFSSISRGGTTVVPDHRV